MANAIRSNISLVVRVAALALLLAAAPGCSLIFGGGRPRPSIVSSDPGQKIPAIKKASDARDSQTARQLVRSLDSDDPAIRFYSIRSLQDITGETFGYVWYAEEPDRRAATEKWERWLNENGGELAGGNHGNGK